MQLITAINQVAAAVGEGPFNSPDSPHPTVTAAKALIDAARLDVLSRGLWFNKDSDVILQPDSSGEVPVPAGTLSCSILSSRQYDGRTRFLVVRAGKVYDPYNATSVIGQPIRADVIMDIAFDDLPIQAANAVMHAARAQFVSDEDGDNNKYQRTLQMAAAAAEELQMEHIRQKRYNAFESPMVSTIIRPGRQRRF